MFLNRIICQMDISISDFLQSPHIRRSSYVAIMIPISSYFIIIRGHKHIGSYIKFTAIVQQWVCYISLKNKRPIFSLIFIFQLIYSISYVFQAVSTHDTVPTISKLPRFYDPIILTSAYSVLHKNANKSFIRLIQKSGFDVEGQRYNIKYIFSDYSVVFL